MADRAFGVLDLRGVPAPWSLLTARAAYNRMNPNDCLEIVVGDQATKDDLLAVFSGTICDVAQDATANCARSAFRIRTRKTGRP